MNSYSQLTVSIHGGYAFPTAASSFLDAFENRTDYGSLPDFKSDHEVLKVSLGKGINIQTRFGYPIIEGVIIELGFNYLKGARFMATHT